MSATHTHATNRNADTMRRPYVRARAADRKRFRDRLTDEAIREATGTVRDVLFIHDGTRTVGGVFASVSRDHDVEACVVMACHRLAAGYSVIVAPHGQFVVGDCIDGDAS